MDDRITDLEVKLAFLEKHIGELDELFQQLHGTVDRLQSEIVALAEAQASDPASTERRLIDEKPPHY